PSATLFPYTTLFRSGVLREALAEDAVPAARHLAVGALARQAQEVAEQHAVDDELARRGAALVGERGVGDRPALVLAADEMVARDDHLLEEDLVELLAAGHLAERAHGDARRLEVADEVADAPGPGRGGIRARQQDAPARELRVARPHLLAAHHPAVAAALGAGAERGQVGARAGLGEELAPELVGGEDRGEEAALLRLRAVRDP